MRQDGASSSHPPSSANTTKKKKLTRRKVPSNVGSASAPVVPSASSASNPYFAAAMPRLPGSSSASPSSLPPAARVRLYELFVQIEREFESLCSENAALQERLDRAERRAAAAAASASQAMTPSSVVGAFHADRGFDLTTAEADATSTASTAPKFQSSPSVVSAATTVTKPGLYAHKLRSHTSRLRAQTNRLMSNLKGQALNCTPLRRYQGHKDGIWEVSVSRMGLPILGTASADHTAMIWGMHSGQALLQYAGHSGSVNSLRFHPNKELVLTASGDGTVHIWQCAVHLHNESSSGRVASSDEEIEAGDKAAAGAGAGGAEGLFHPGLPPHYPPLLDEDANQFSVLRTPLRSLTGHSGVVIAADWLPGGEQAVTAGWDRQACIWDAQTGEMLHALSGHDEELTHASAHPTSRLVVTASKDSTFRLWDFREAIHSVSVFQGHQDTVTSAVFSSDSNQVVSGSDDRSARIWDLRNMRTPVAMIQSDSSVNRLAISQAGLVAIPFDNRNVRIYDLNGTRIARLPRSSRQGHSRMVCCAAWSEDTKPNLFTCGFDRVTLGWSVQPREVVSKVATASMDNPAAEDNTRMSLALRGVRETTADLE